jgi:hypothetical protein
VVIGLAVVVVTLDVDIRRVVVLGRLVVGATVGRAETTRWASEAKASTVIR